MRLRCLSYVLAASVVILALTTVGCGFRIGSRDQGIKIRTPSSGSSVIPPTPVTGSYLTGLLVDGDANPLVDAALILSGNDFKTRTNTQGEFSIPVSKISTPIVPVKIVTSTQVIHTDIELPADLLASVNQARVDAGEQPFEGLPVPQRSPALPDGSRPALVLNRKLGLQVPQNSVEDIRPQSNAEAPKQRLVVFSVPVSTGADEKTFSLWTKVENLSTDTTASFAWDGLLSTPSVVKIIFSPNEFELSNWDGRTETRPLWPGVAAGANLISDYSQCTQSTYGTPTAGPLSSASKCSMNRNQFPFNEGRDVHFRLIAEVGSEIKFSPVFSIISANTAPSLSVISDQVLLVNSTPASIDVTLRDNETPLTCAASLTVSSSNEALLPAVNITIGGKAPNCKVYLEPMAGQVGTSQLIVTANDGSLTRSSVFQLTVNPVLPVIASIQNMSTLVNGPAVSFAVSISDPDGPAQACNGTFLRYTSSNTNVVPATGAVVWGGTWPNCTATISAPISEVGDSIVSISASDGGGFGEPVMFVFTANPQPKLWVSSLTTEVMTGSNEYQSLGHISLGPNDTSVQSFFYYPAGENGQAYLAVVKRNALGEVVWSRKLTPHVGSNLGSSGAAPSVIVKPDGSSVVAWMVLGSPPLYVFSFDAQGHLQWQKQFTLNSGLYLRGMSYLPMQDTVLLIGQGSNLGIGVTVWLGLSADGTVVIRKSMTMSSAVDSYQALELSNGRLVLFGELASTSLYVGEFAPDVSSYSGLYSYPVRAGQMGAKLSAGQLIFAGIENRIVKMNANYEVIQHRDLGRNITNSGIIGLAADAFDRVYLAGRTALGFSSTTPVWPGTWSDGGVSRLSADLSAVDFTTQSSAFSGSSSGYTAGNSNSQLNPLSGRFLAHWATQSMNTGRSVMAVGHKLALSTTELTSADHGNGSASALSTTDAQSTGDYGTLSRTSETWSLSDVTVTEQPLTHTATDASNELTWSLGTSP